MTKNTSELEQIETATRQWVQNVVLGLNLCPFAHTVVRHGHLQVLVEPASEFEVCLNTLAAQFDPLLAGSSEGTLLLVLPNGFEDFDTYLDMAATAEALLEDLGYQGLLQVATFHPQYQFDGVVDNDPANYTNRSPYPMLHLLREDAVELAIATHPNVDAIPENNIQRMRELGIAELNALVLGMH